MDYSDYPQKGELPGTKIDSGLRDGAVRPKNFLTILPAVNIDTTQANNTQGNYRHRQTLMNLGPTLIPAIIYLLIFTNTVQGGVIRTVFTCDTTDNRQLSVAKNDKKIFYSFGRKDHLPDLKLETSVRDAKISLGNVSGNEVSNSIVFNNGGYRYVVFSTADRNADNQVLRHGVLIHRRSTYLGYKKCVPDTVTGSLLDLVE